MASTRVYILAKKLGVKSEAIVKKCQDENLDVKNHMSTISAGLAATIREWFSGAENITAIETSKKVDLKKVRIRKKPQRKRAVSKRKTKKVQQQTLTEAAEMETEQAASVTTEPEISAPQEQPQAQRLEDAAAPVITPAGPMLETPAPARLTGPEVVRIEQPEPERRPRTKRKKVADEVVTEPLISKSLSEESTIVISPKESKRKPKAHKVKGHVRKQYQQDQVSPDKAKLSKWRQRDIEERQARLAAAVGEKLRLRPARKIATKTAGEVVLPSRPKKAFVAEPIIVRELSSVLAVKTTDIIAKLMEQGIMATANQAVATDAAEIAALEFGTELIVERKSTCEEQIRTEFEQRERKNLAKRAVVATMLGHVDHGKTSLLDKIRSTAVTAGEAGGITQHIGAYQVNIKEHTVTFLDTPGHKAFTAMRARGANMTDVAVLVVAADDGVMPQTIEAISHAKAANVPVIVALNKCDLPGCDINRIYSQLAEHDLSPVEWGGQTEVVHTSAVTGEGIDDLLEHLDYVAELLELQADDTIPATGWVVEAKMSAQRGPVATLLVKEGQLKKGDIILAGATYGRVKSLRNSHGKSIKVAKSSMPVEITGLNDVPQASDRFYCLADINKAKTAADENRTHSREASLATTNLVTLDNLFSQLEAGKTKELNVIIRADVQGSVDVLTKYLADLSTVEVRIRILQALPGGITEGDVVLAEASNAIIIGFNVACEEHVARSAESKGVEIRTYDVIYRITEDLEKSMVGLLEPETVEKSLGRAVIKTMFKISRIGTIAGCYVTDGVARKNAKVRLIRDNIVIRNDLSISSLKHFKDDASEVKAGLECGIKLEKYDDVKDDDVLEFYELVKVARVLT